MAGKVFIDANVFIYAQDNGSPTKQRRSREVIRELIEAGEGVTSTQVLQEFYVAATRKLGVEPMAADAVLKTFGVFEIVQVTPALIHDAVGCSILNGINFWDALVIAAAAAAGCSTILTEDLNPGQNILGVKVQNPFLAEP